MQWQPWQPWAEALPDILQDSSKLAIAPLPESGCRLDRAQDAPNSAPAPPTDRTKLYDLAELLLAELIPGWHQGDLEEDGLDDDDDGEDDCFDDGYDDELLPPGFPDPVVEASYQMCMLEAERYLVQYEGFDAEGSVVVGLRQHLQRARAHAAADVRAGASPGPRHRPPGYP